MTSTAAASPVPELVSFHLIKHALLQHLNKDYHLNEKLVPWGTDGRLPLSGDFRSLILE